ncbi:unnamed protein product, partial [Staurois parvus]
MTRDCGHGRGDGQRLRTRYRGWPETADTYRGWPETADTVQGMARDCGHGTGDGQ